MRYVWLVFAVFTFAVGLAAVAETKWVMAGLCLYAVGVMGYLSHKDGELSDSREGTLILLWPGVVIIVPLFLLLLEILRWRNDAGRN